MTMDVYTASSSSHSRMLPSSALHRAVKLKSAGVLGEPTFCTYATDQSRVISARSIITTAASAATSDVQP